MIDKLAKIADKFEEITALLSQPEIINDSKKLQNLSKEQAKILPIYDLYQVLNQKSIELSENSQMASDSEEDPEMRELAKAEAISLTKEIEKLNQDAQILLLPKDPDDDKNTILEIRAGTGGDEAGLFVADLFRMYQKFAELNKWKFDVMNSSATGIGGFKEIVASIEGKHVFSRLKFEMGTHRVQRVPATETQGRVHTSAVTVAVLPESEDIDIEINTTDLKIDTYRSQGAGGQHVNTTDSAIRITHVPTGVVVTCQEERSQIKNRAKAMKHLKAKLYEIQIEAAQSEEAEMRKKMVGSGDRSERIRTYNYPQGLVTDHRIGLKLYKLDSIINGGDLDCVIDPLTTHQEAELLKNQSFA
ncbi:MAG: peptide chain release factor 1 [Deltaproteobacteria bacterium]|jgi:peptide chain release factor 1|nr:peptide chain release factor 1 [Deltaproteobacteria bacterium]MBT4525059.1 peptide chain release factor 1 [Deltaproteobacteria bacterium]